MRKAREDRGAEEHYFGYAIRFGFNSKIYSDRNIFNAPGVMPIELPIIHDF